MSAGTCPTTGRYTGTALLDMRGHLGLSDGPLSLWLLADDSLARLHLQHLRASEDFATDGDAQRARRESYMAREIKDQQLMRFCLRMRYGALDDHVGTSVYDCYIRHNEAPGYALALFMDHGRARLGRRHVLSWPQAVEAV